MEHNPVSWESGARLVGSGYRESRGKRWSPSSGTTPSPSWRTGSLSTCSSTRSVERAEATKLYPLSSTCRLGLSCRPLDKHGSSDPAGVGLRLQHDSNRADVIRNLVNGIRVSSLIEGAALVHLNVVRGGGNHFARDVFLCVHVDDVSEANLTIGAKDGDDLSHLKHVVLVQQVLIALLPVGRDRHSRLWLDPLPLWELHRSSGPRCWLLGSWLSSRPSSWGVGKWVFPGRLACRYLVPVRSSRCWIIRHLPIVALHFLLGRRRLSRLLHPIKHGRGAAGGGGEIGHFRSRWSGRSEHVADEGEGIRSSSLLSLRSLARRRATLRKGLQLLKLSSADLRQTLSAQFLLHTCRMAVFAVLVELARLSRRDRLIADGTCAANLLHLGTED
mmetsp:Transcript_28532/g.92080  ORF Transcript_28532/g.92080 Transcript_28532/m.92080 type:complete len:388 (+) Transcript_28532:1144-2307(+)